MKLLSYCDRVIEYSFYALFFLVPLVFSGDTSELFELNKMWLTFGLTALIGATWAIKMVIQKRIIIQRTPLDIILLLFLLSQIISSIFTLDSHISWWGYYSRFNGGLLSTICYVLLYYAFVTNLARKQVLKTLFISLISGLVVALWGFPSHFGADPTCLMFRGNFDTSCWTDAFKPTIRAFSTLGQPAWLAAYMAFLIPLSAAYTLYNKKNTGKFISYFALTIFLYILLIFAQTRAGFLAFWIANVIFWAAIYFKKIYSPQYFFKMLISINLVFAFCSFIFGSPMGSLEKYTLPILMQQQAPAATPAAAAPTAAPAAPAASSSIDDITDSGNIRLLVWKGAIKAWENNPIFGTGVETFAFAYYKYKSPAHNLTSEWDYLYNKAHNEYLNYLATTGIFGLGTYLGFIALFFFFSGKWFINRHIQKTHEKFKDTNVYNQATLLLVGLIAGYISILISNFFGFSVVIINLYTFLTPVFIFILLGLIDTDRQIIIPQRAAETGKHHELTVNSYQWTGIVIFIGIACWMVIGLLWYRQADIAYALGNNLDKIGNFQQAYPQLLQAVQMVPKEPVYQDELSINLAALGATLYAQKNPQAIDIAKNAITLSNDVVQNHPNNVVYWKDRVRLFYTLSTSDTQDAGALLQQAINAIDTAKNLAPTDGKIAYNQAILYGQAGELQQAIQMLQDTIRLKPDYVDAYSALGLFYHESAIDKNGKVIHPDMQQKAIDTYTYMLDHLTPNSADIKKNLEQWRSQ